MSEAIKLFQYNTLGALMAGLYGGTLNSWRIDWSMENLGSRNIRFYRW